LPEPPFWERKAMERINAPSGMRECEHALMLECGNAIIL
jgi:hypothetical protein